ncbi:hypothetical protein ACLOJK_011822 [Asimina triloba]
MTHEQARPHRFKPSTTLFPFLLVDGNQTSISSLHFSFCSRFLLFSCLKTRELAMAMPVKKQSKGRQKIEINRIEGQDARQVAFSKRRKGIFKKARELCILCGARIAVIAFSPAGKAFSFGHPSVSAVIRRFINGDGSELVSSREEDDGDNIASADVAEEEGENLEQQIDDEGDGNAASWWDSPIENMALEDLEEFKNSLEELRRKVRSRVDEISAAS